MWTAVKIEKSMTASHGRWSMFGVRDKGVLKVNKKWCGSAYSGKGERFGGRELPIKIIHLSSELLKCAIYIKTITKELRI